MNRRTAAPDNGRWGHRCCPGDGHDLFKESRKYIEVFIYIYIHIQNNMCFLFMFIYVVNQGQTITVYIWLVVSNMFYFPFHIWDVILPID